MPTIAYAGVAMLTLLSFVASPLAAQVRYSFSRQLLDALADPDAGPQAMIVSDVDRTNGPDVLAVETEGNSVDVYLNDGTGDFPEGATSFDTDYGPVAVAIGDFDVNGIPDIVTANNVGTVSVLLGLVDGDFDDTSETRDIHVGAAAVGVVVADFNRDGKADVAALNDTSLYLLKGNGDGTFVPFPTPVVQILGSGAAGVAAAD